MILQLQLEHVRTQVRQTLDIWGIPSDQVTKILQQPPIKIADGRGGWITKPRINYYVSDIVNQRLPTHLFNFQVIDWEFKDHGSANNELEAPR